MTARLTPNRRTFLKTSAAALAAPTIISSRAFAKDDQPAPSDRVVVGSIGTGDLGRRHHLANKLLPNKRIEVAAVCDVDRNHRDQAALDVLNRTGKRVGIYKDFRDLCDRNDIDAVLIAVPDHWHALIAIDAMESGKDVYCEKPLTLTIDEGKAMVAAARRYGTVFQTGSQQRSDARFRLACELVRNRQVSARSRASTRTSATSTPARGNSRRPAARAGLELLARPGALQRLLRPIAATTSSAGATITPAAR